MRAAGLQGDAPPEIIEILDDDTGAFGNRAPSHTLPDDGGPRWIGLVAALALVAVIGYGIATSASSGGLPKASPAPSTTHAVPQTTLPPATTVATLKPPVPYYAADAPRPYKVRFAEITQDVRSSPLDFQMWAKPGATATSGSWFSMVNLRGTSTIYAQNAYRLHSDQGTFAISHTPSGQTSIQFSNDRSTSLVFTAFGWSDEDLLRLAESVNVDSAEPAFSDAS
ncbi:MAG TPA: hypothetical protein VHN36_01235, partial [Ilumatobacteraceae bacterium]|nr:hypothetical protein [Ilumatobacteraceae bacterium]